MTLERLDVKCNVNVANCDKDDHLQQFDVSDIDGTVRARLGDGDWCIMTTGKLDKV